MSSNPFSTERGICRGTIGQIARKVSQADGNGFQSTDHPSDEAQFVDHMVKVDEC